MNRTANAALVRRLRTEKAWSQEELAIAAGLSTRTIQRIEADGAGSVSSLKAIASALEVDMHNLESKPRTHLIVVRWGFGGVIFGATCASASILANWLTGEGSAADTGIAFGAVGFLAGVSCALIGWTSSRY